MQITHDRIDTVNKLHNMKTNVAVKDLQETDGIACGTEVQIELFI
jgi:hypothetical protein